MKRIFTALALAFAITLTACADGEDDEQPSSTVSSEETSQTSQTEGSSEETTQEKPPVSIPVEDDWEIETKGLCGEDITVRDFFKDHPAAGEGISASLYSYDGFGYCSLSDGRADCRPCEPYNAEPFIEPCDLKFQHIDVGSKLGELELASADGVISVDKGNVRIELQKLTFSGKLTMKGYVHLCQGNEPYAVENSVWFYPTDGEWEGLPFNDRSVNSQYLGKDRGHFWCGNAPVLDLGIVDKSFYSLISEAGDKVQEVTVTIGDLVLGYADSAFYIYSYSVNSAKLYDISVE